jgi:two-component system, NarL family, response regulator DegU
MGYKASPCRILIADDHALVREEMRAMLASEPDLEVVGDAENGEEALAMCCRLHPNLVLMDVSMPRMGGFEATRAIKERYSGTAVLIVTAHQGQDYLQEGTRAGAVGVISKGAPKEQLVNAVRSTFNDGPLL